MTVAYYADTTQCPCCGSTLSANDQLHVNAPFQIATRHGRRACLTRAEMKILQIMMDPREPLTRWRLIERVYADDPTGGPENAASSVGTLITRIRQKLAPLGVRIEKYRVVQT